MPEVASASVKISPDFAGFNSALDQGLNRQIQTTAQNATRLGGSLTAAVSLPVAAIGTAAVSAFRDFDGALTESLAIVTDFGSTTREDFERTAKEVARSSTVTATEAAQAFFYLASAGLDAEQQIAALPQVARFAQAGMFDMARATDLATDAQSALGLTVPEATQNLANMTRVTDVLTKANILANGSVEQFATALTNRAGSALRLVNKDIEEGVAVLAAFADQGIKGEEAGTRLDIVLRDLQTKALSNADAFTKYGITVFDSTGNVRNMADILADLEGAFAGASDETKRATLLQLGFSDRSVASLLSLVGYSDKIREYEAALRSAGGATEDVANKQLKSFDAQLKLAKNQITEAAISLGQDLAPTVLAAAQGIAALTGAFTKLPEPIKRAVIITAGLAAAAGPLLLIGGKIAQAVLAFRALSAAQTQAAASALGVAAAEGQAAVAIGAAGTAAASTAARSGIGGLLARRGGLFSAGGLAKGLGISFATELGAGFVQGLDTQEGTIGDKVKDTTANALRGAGIGAAIGSVVPVLGTGLGAAIGGGLGAAVGLFSKPAADAAEDAASGINDKFAEAIGDLSPRQQQLVEAAVSDTVSTAMSRASEIGLDIEAAGAIGDAVEKIFIEGIARGLSVEDISAALDDTTLRAIANGLATPAQIADSIARGKQAGLAYAEGTAAGLDEGLEAAVGPSFAEAFDAATTGGASLIAAVQQGIADSGGSLDLGIVADTVAASVQEIPSIFENAFAGAKRTSATAILDLVQAQSDAYSELGANLETITNAGLLAVADQIAAGGPKAAAEAEAIANALTEGSDAPFRIEAELRGIADENVDAFLAGFSDATPEETAAGFVELFVKPFHDDLSSDDGAVIGNQFGDGIARGVDASMSRAIAVARSRAAQLAAETRATLGIQSPSTVGQEIGASFVAGINLGITRSDLVDVPVPGGGGSRTGSDDGPAAAGTVKNTYIEIHNPTVEDAGRDAQKAAVLDRLAGVA